MPPCYLSAGLLWSGWELLGVAGSLGIWNQYPERSRVLPSQTSIRDNLAQGRRGLLMGGCPQLVEKQGMGKKEGNHRMGMPLSRQATGKRDPAEGCKYDDSTCSRSIHEFLSAPSRRYREPVGAS